MPISETQRARLLARQEELVDFFLEHSDPEKWGYDLSTKEGRGNLAWHTRIVSTILGISIRIEQFFPSALIPDDDEEGLESAEKIIRRSEKLAKSYLKRIGVKQ